jgi:hypothetical protein
MEAFWRNEVVIKETFNPEINRGLLGSILYYIGKKMYKGDVN